LQGGISLPVGDRCEQPVCDHVQKASVDIVVGLKGTLRGARQHRWAAGVAGRGIGRGTDDLAGKMLDRLIDVFDDIWMGWGYGQDRCVR